MPMAGMRSAEKPATQMTPSKTVSTWMTACLPDDWP